MHINGSIILINNYFVNMLKSCPGFILFKIRAIYITRFLLVNILPIIPLLFLLLAFVWQASVRFK